MLGRRLFRLLPFRLQASLYRRCICPRRLQFGAWFERAPLLLAPTVAMRLSPRDSFHGEIAFCGIYEPDESRLLLQLASNPGGLLVDAGANYGYYSLLWCAAREENRAIAIEASPSNARALRDNIEMNGMGDRIQVMECAVSNRDGTARFEIGSQDETGWGGIASEGADQTLEVQTRRLDAILDEPVAVLKVDCEGADAWVIEGAEGLFKRGFIRNVFFEENSWRQDRLGIAAGVTVKCLREYGFQVRDIGGGKVNFFASRLS